MATDTPKVIFSSEIIGITMKIVDFLIQEKRNERINEIRADKVETAMLEVINLNDAFLAKEFSYRDQFNDILFPENNIKWEIAGIKVVRDVSNLLNENERFTNALIIVILTDKESPHITRDIMIIKSLYFSNSKRKIEVENEIIGDVNLNTIFDKFGDIEVFTEIVEEIRNFRKETLAY